MSLHVSLNLKSQRWLYWTAQVRVSKGNKKEARAGASNCCLFVALSGSWICRAACRSAFEQEPAPAVGVEITHVGHGTASAALDTEAWAPCLQELLCLAGGCPWWSPGSAQRPRASARLGLRHWLRTPLITAAYVAVSRREEIYSLQPRVSTDGILSWGFNTRELNAADLDSCGCHGAWRTFMIKNKISIHSHHRDLNSR